MSPRAQQPALAIARRCEWCQKQLAFSSRKDAKFCSQVCRQWAFRLRRRQTTAVRNGEPMRFAYYDPPFPGLAQKYYSMPEVDHAALIAEAVAQKWDGWALSTSARALRQLLPLMPEDTYVCPWVKPHTPAARTNGIHNCWEVLLVVGGRQTPPGRRDWLSALPARSGGTLPGRKPIAFVVWLYELFGFAPGDTLFEKFPGTGIITRGFQQLSSGSPGDASLLQEHDTSTVAAPDVSSSAVSDAVPSAGAQPVRPPECATCGDDPMKCELQEGCSLVEVSPGPSADATLNQDPLVCCLVCGVPLKRAGLCPDHDCPDTRRRFGLRQRRRPKEPEQMALLSRRGSQ